MMMMMMTLRVLRRHGSRSTAAATAAAGRRPDQCHPFHRRLVLRCAELAPLRAEKHLRLLPRRQRQPRPVRPIRSTRRELRSTEFIILKTKFLVFDTQFLVLDTKFLVSNTQFISLYSPQWRRLRLPPAPPPFPAIPLPTSRCVCRSVRVRRSTLVAPARCDLPA